MPAFVYELGACVLQEVELCVLQGRPELNGRRGRVLPSSGRGAPPSAPAAGRVAVRLAPQGGQAPEVIAVKTTNLRSPHASTAAGHATGSAAAAAGSTSRQQKPQQQQQQQPSARRQRILQLLKDEFELWETGATIDTRNLKKAGLKQHMIRCGEDVPEYVALKRDAHFRPTPAAHEAVQLRCLDCFAALAERAGMPLTAEGAEEFCGEYMMGAMETCWTLMGMERMSWGGERLGEGRLY